MSLHGSTTELQNALAQLYLKFKQRFSENALIRELWSCMAHDISQQMGSFKSFPSSFWLHLGKDQKDQDYKSLHPDHPQSSDKLDRRSLGLLHYGKGSPGSDYAGDRILFRQSDSYSALESVAAEL